jgi:hypothetical protein
MHAQQNYLAIIKAQSTSGAIKTNPKSPVYSSNTFILRDTKTSYLFVDCGEGAASITPPATGNNSSPDTKVINPTFAWDADPATYSTLFVDKQEKDVTISQIISFASPAKATDVVVLTMALDEALLNNNDYIISAQAFNGATGVGTIQDISNSLFLKPTTTDYRFSPGVVFDRVVISVMATQNGNKTAAINLYYVRLSPAPPISQTSNGGVSSAIACQGSVLLSVSNPASGIDYRWYNSTNTLVQNSTSSTYAPPSLAPGNYIYYVSATKTGCSIESAKDEINLTVNPKPASPTIALTN